ncbi:hypothetical protein Thiowin_02970 [Thiorhodovibrio winogradskyi]|uniref:Filamentous haemagglutinin FhaB/tRNA nuclease CdiA-like TPS domain-containing protein n=1 Tax=Thiorhodovibrio winogradskyi TaxID=77007 RepID=A0ABZ0SAM2_9GAMM|nr:filamentous hemagglutinin N-terminal domain-containing protein [Thiorhodovibrio winogradskyi]
MSWPPNAPLGFSSPALIAGAGILLCASTLRADIATDGSLGPMVQLAGPDMRIGAELGQTRGGNLFHSFQRFNIPTNQSATFTGPDSIQNIISRVTGGEISYIDGTLRSEVGQADLYLINPAGVVMGPNASVDVPASLHVSTADELRFSDGSRFSARDPGASTLTLAAPEAFGFLGQQPAANLQINGSRLEVQPGKTLSLSAGDLSIQGAGVQPARIKAPGGTIQLAALGDSAGVVSMSQPATITDDAVAHSGQLEIASAGLDARGEGGGLIALQAGTAHLIDTQFSVENQGTTDSHGGISARIGGDFNLNDSDLFADTAAGGRGGSIDIEAGNLHMVNSQLTSDSYLTDSMPTSVPMGAAGGISIKVDGLLQLRNESVIQSKTDTDGNAGRIDIVASVIALDASDMSARTDGIGTAGDVRLFASDAIYLANGSAISALSSYSAEYPRLGEAGHIHIETDTLSLLDSSIDVPSGNLAKAGVIEVIANRIHADSTIDASGFFHGLTVFDTNNVAASFGPVGPIDLTADGQSGDILLTASDIVFDHGAKAAINTNAGDGGSLHIRADTLALLNGSQFQATTSGRGQGGTIDLEVGGTFIIEGGQPTEGFTLSGGILTSSAALNLPGRPSKTGSAGPITISADTLIIGQDSRISSESISNGSSGPISITVGTLEARNGGWISSGTLGQGTAAPILIEASELVHVHSTHPTFFLRGSHIGADSGFQLRGGASGLVQIAAPTIIVEQGGEISSATYGGGAGGAINLINISELTLLSGGNMSSSTYGTQSAGTINIQSDSILINGEQANLYFSETGIFSESERSATGNAGNIHIEASSLLLTGGAKISTESQQADAGPIQISGGYLWLQDSQITTSAEGLLGNGGDITLTPEQLILEGGFIRANTRAANASGGDIHIGSQALIASGNQIEIGGNERQVFSPGSGRNIIQAAAPQGVQGEISVTTPELDMTASLVPLRAPFQDTNAILSDLCQLTDTREASALIELGSGGLPPDAGEPLPATLGSERLQRLLRATR